MAINTILCIGGTNEKLDYNGNPINVGEFWSAWNDLTPGQEEFATRACVIAGDEELIGSTLTAVTEYNSCYECLVDNYTIVGLEPCNTDIVPFNATLPLSAIGFIPIEGSVIYAQVTITDRGELYTYTSCFQWGGLQQVSESEYLNTYEPTFSTIDQIIFSNFNFENACEQCLNGFTAGTESTICQICCPCTTGETITSVSSPHPTWTNGQGQAITQLNAITLGGPNGLNN
jgi:hypothetical protein